MAAVAVQQVAGTGSLQQKPCHCGRALTRPPLPAASPPAAATAALPNWMRVLITSMGLVRIVAEATDRPLVQNSLSRRVLVGVLRPSGDVAGV